MYIHIYVYMYIYIPIYTYIYPCIPLYFPKLLIYIHLPIYIYTHMYTYMYVCIYIYVPFSIIFIIHISSLLDFHMIYVIFLLFSSINQVFCRKHSISDFHHSRCSIFIIALQSTMPLQPMCIPIVSPCYFPFGS